MHSQGLLHRALLLLPQAALQQLVPTGGHSACWQSAPSIGSFCDRFLNLSIQSCWCLKSRVLSILQGGYQSEHKHPWGWFSPALCSVCWLCPQPAFQGTAAGSMPTSLGMAWQGTGGCSSWEVQIWDCIGLVILNTLNCSNKSLGVSIPPSTDDASSSTAKWCSFISGCTNIWCFSQSLSLVSQAIMSIYQLPRCGAKSLPPLCPFQQSWNIVGREAKRTVWHKHITEATSRIHLEQRPERKEPDPCSCLPPGCSGLGSMFDANPFHIRERKATATSKLLCHTWLPAGWAFLPSSVLLSCPPSLPEAERPLILFWLRRSWFLQEHRFQQS